MQQEQIEQIQVHPIDEIQQKIGQLQIRDPQLCQIRVYSIWETYKSQEMVFRFPHRDFLNLTTNLQQTNFQEINRNEFMILQQLGTSDYTCEIILSECDNNNFFWVTTAYMRLGTLKMDLLNSSNIGQASNLSISIISKIGNKLKTILSYFHAKNIFHLDVCPNNILLHDEFQFIYQNVQDDAEWNVQMGLQEIRNKLGIQEAIDDFKANYNQFQDILQQFFYSDSRDTYLINFIQKKKPDFAKEFYFWIRRWITFSGRDRFNPYNVKVEVGLKICFCDFRSSLTNAQNPINFQLVLSESPFKILYDEERNENVFIQFNRRAILIQHDLFCLGRTLLHVLVMNRHIVLYNIESNQEYDDNYWVQFFARFGLNFFQHQIQKEETKQKLLRYYSINNQLEQIINNPNTDQTLRELLRMILNMHTLSLVPINNNQQHQIIDFNLQEIERISSLKRALLIEKQSQNFINQIQQ